MVRPAPDLDARFATVGLAACEPDRAAVYALGDVHERGLELTRRLLRPSRLRP